MPAWLAQKLPGEANSLDSYKVEGDGDCLFSSVELILASVGRRHSAEELRKVVAAAVLATGDPLIDASISSWHTIYQQALKENDQDLMREYAHAANIKKTPLDRSAREDLYRRMMDRRVYWGDQHAIRVLEQQLHVKFLIVDSRMLNGSVVYDDVVRASALFFLLSLSGRHYSPLSYKKKMVLSWNDLPQELQNLFQHIKHV